MPGLAPFTGGLLLALYMGYKPDWKLITIGYIGITLIMLATYYSNEYFDYEGDLINKNFNKFSGGSRALSENLLPRKVGLYALISSLIAFGTLTVIYIIRGYFEMRPLLLYMAVIGIFAGIFYSAPPFRWAYRGVGELLIWFSYGWLSVASSYYIVTGKIDLAITLFSLPAAFTVFSVILINEVPDYEADLAVSKRNIIVRLGRKRARIIYIISNLLATITAFLFVLYIKGLLEAIITLALLGAPFLYISVKVLDDSVFFDFRKRLERICSLTVLLNALTPFIVLAPLLI